MRWGGDWLTLAGTSLGQSLIYSNNNCTEEQKPEKGWSVNPMVMYPSKNVVE